ncbi:MAG: hypothetical protein BWY42_01177 [Candidatus Omnitrophica bacterium ADurb.Bin277]|nr:MAG: hypothetical protein BWY42_01177 [Candidatus Omnitrophica bacterium ADurb.Bin277]
MRFEIGLLCKAVEKCRRSFLIQFPVLDPDEFRFVIQKNARRGRSGKFARIEIIRKNLFAFFRVREKAEKRRVKFPRRAFESNGFHAIIFDEMIDQPPERTLRVGNGVGILH